MLFGRKKTNVIDRRLKELQKEMERIQGELNTAARPEAAKPPRAPAPPGPVFVVKPPLGRDENDLFTRASRQAQEGGAEAAGQGASPSFFDQADANPQAGRKKFANYFMAGHFQNLRPSRQESRIVRNKAIVMVILVLALIFWLVYYLQTH